MWARWGDIFRLSALALMAIGGLEACVDAEVPAGIGTRAVVIGIDGADWAVVDAIAAHGKLPNLAALRERGVTGSIRTAADIALSPVIWTSVATGKTADRHGISWFLVDRPDGTRAPVRSHNRKAKALWNLLGRARPQTDRHRLVGDLPRRRRG
jgi:predicted AlkP superfamily phosphohydrolase/phosphomutase